MKKAVRNFTTAMLGVFIFSGVCLMSQYFGEINTMDYYIENDYQIKGYWTVEQMYNNLYDKVQLVAIFTSLAIGLVITLNKK